MPALAHFGSTVPAGTPTNNVSLGNDYIHPMDDWNLATMDAAVNWSMANVFDPTDLLMWDTTGAWDTRLHEGDWGNNGVVGWHVCPPGATQGGAHPDRWCADGAIYFNDGGYPWYFDTRNERRSIACHEIGHAVGLRHTNDGHAPASCMVTDSSDNLMPNFANRVGLSSTDNSHLNANY